MRSRLFEMFIIRVTNNICAEMTCILVNVKGVYDDSTTYIYNYFNQSNFWPSQIVFSCLVCAYSQGLKLCSPPVYRIRFTIVWKWVHVWLFILSDSIFHYVETLRELVSTNPTQYPGANQRYNNFLEHKFLVAVNLILAPICSDFIYPRQSYESGHVC